MKIKIGKIRSIPLKDLKFRKIASKDFVLKI